MSLDRYKRGPVVFEESYDDDILGTPHTRSDMVRDRDGKLRRRDDLGEPDRDHLLEGWQPRVERPIDPL